MEKNKLTESALEHVDVRRRGFLGKLLATGAAAAALPAMSTMALGADPLQEEGQGKGKGKGKGKGDAKGKGKRPDPAAMAKRMIETHDKDGDGALNEKELTEALTAMMRQRIGGRGKGKGDGKGKGKGKGDGKGKGRP